ncbi:unnamed protein product, partial [Fusarium fujikuroi]
KNLPMRKMREAQSQRKDIKNGPQMT